MNNYISINNFSVDNEKFKLYYRLMAEDQPIPVEIEWSVKEVPHKRKTFGEAVAHLSDLYFGQPGRMSSEEHEVALLPEVPIAQGSALDLLSDERYERLRKAGHDYPENR